ncbi:hypothetical protein CPLU01_02580 [Colletotrichum plurivorum]|uniref:Uncharacterized protein n=1 Tax=Colletotrichum plurivorum TaxID=2175906 RepID=A0A8H6NLV8_9PEZI|nr:hypothetical protein CPLU01_02580 [Colletotrichum plurivorum]
MRRRALLILGSFTVRGSPGVPSKPTTTFRSPPPRRLPPLTSIPSLSLSLSLTAAHEYVPHTALSSGRRYLPISGTCLTQHPALFSALQSLRYTGEGTSTAQLGEFTESAIFPSSHLCAPRTASLGPNVPSSPSTEHDHDTMQSASPPRPFSALCTTPAAYITCAVRPIHLLKVPCLRTPPSALAHSPALLRHQSARLHSPTPQSQEPNSTTTAGSTRHAAYRGHPAHR